MNLKARMAGIAANLDDLNSRGSKRVCERAIRFRPTSRNSTGRAMRPCCVLSSGTSGTCRLYARDQRVAMQGLREGISRLQEELKRSSGVVQTAPAPGCRRSPERLPGQALSAVRRFGH